MLRQLKLRDRLVAMVAVQLLIVAVLAVGSLLFLDSDTGIRGFGVFALIGLVVGLVASVIVGRSILDSIGELTTAAETIAKAQSALAKDGTTPPDFAPVPVNEGDPQLGPLAIALNTSQEATAGLNDASESAVRAGLSGIVVNLARRNQSLLDRQVEYIDSLEVSEEDPDRLHELFKVDHLATRMRRNAESLLVLADAEPARRRGGPVEIADVLRVAMGEVENYQNIELVEMADGQVSSGTAVDLAHMIAELMENATQFSPPETQVKVEGQFAGDRFQITIADSGLGMGADQLAAANETLANPPELGLAIGRSLGFAVIGRLARRLQATVALRESESSGLTAVVDLPKNHFIGAQKEAEDTTSTPPSLRAAEPAEAPTPEPVDLETEPQFAPAEDDSTDRRPKTKIRADRDRLNSEQNNESLSKLLGIDPTSSSMESEGWTPPTVSADEPLETARHRRSSDDGQDPKDGTSSDAASNEPKRKKKSQRKRRDDSTETEANDANAAETNDVGMATILAGGGRDEDATWSPPEVSVGEQEGSKLVQRTRGATQTPIAETRAVAPSSRKPEEVRSMLSKYRDGLKDGRKNAAPSGTEDNGKDEA